jgi:hypothetical protein
LHERKKEIKFRKNPKVLTKFVRILEVLDNQKGKMNRYFNAFKNEISWFNYYKEPIEVFEIGNFNLTKKFQEIYPNMTELIKRSAKTGVDFKGKSMVLFTWEIGEELSGWMCQFDNPTIQLIEEHQILIDNIGGIIHSFNGPESIELNGVHYNHTLTLNQDFMFVGSMNTDKIGWEEYYLEWCRNGDFQPIDLSNSVFFTREADGSQYFYDRITKEVKLFSVDNAFRFIEPIPNQPIRSMYTIKGLSKFTEFVELTAKQWIEYFHLKKKAVENRVDGPTSQS